MVQLRMAREPGYGEVAKSLHWLIVLLLVAQFALAWTMPEIHRGTRPETLINLHLSVGTVILLVALFRLAWRLRFPVPLLADDVPRWQHRAAQASHGLLYLLLLLMPLLGWANASARGWRIDFFGVTALPPLLPENSPLGRALGDVHIWTSYVLLGLIGVHVAAALYHHFWLGDRVLRRMLWGGR
jgi:cytochrome b561